MPTFVHTTQHKMAYALFMVIGIAIKGVAIFGSDGDQNTSIKVQGAYDAVAESIWCIVVYTIYISKNPNYNETYLKYVLPPLYVFSTIYSFLRGFSGYAALSGAVIWGIYSLIVGIFLFFDQPTAYFRRKYNHPRLGWIQTPIGFDGVYFSYYVFMALSIGPGAGIILAYTTHTDAFYYEAVLKSISIQMFGIAVINIIERISLRTSSETRLRTMSLQFYLLIDTIQTILFLETEAFGWTFIKVVLVQEVGGLFLHSGMKEVILWVLGIAYNDQNPLMSTSLPQLKKQFSMHMFINISSCIIAYVVFTFENMALDMAPSYNMTMTNTSGIEIWNYQEKGCALTCLGFRTDRGTDVANSPEVVMSRETSRAGEVLGAVFLMRFIFWFIERRLCVRLHKKFSQFSTAVELKKESERFDRTTRDEMTVKIEDMEPHELTKWLRGNYADILSADAERLGVDEVDYINDPQFSLDRLNEDKLWDDAGALRKAFYSKCVDAKEFGVEIRRRKAHKKEEEEEDDEEEDEEAAKITRIINDKDFSNIASIPMPFLCLSLWMSIHHTVMAFRTATEMVMMDDTQDNNDLVFEKTYAD